MPLRASCSSPLLCLSWVGMGGARSSRLPFCFPVVLRCVQGWALTLSRLPIPWAGNRGPLPLVYGRARCGYGRPAPTPHRTLWRAGVARWVGGRGHPEGVALCLRQGRLGLGAHPPSAASLSGRQLRSAAHVLWVTGVQVWGPGIGPLGLHALSKIACRGAGGKLPGGGFLLLL